MDLNLDYGEWWCVVVGGGGGDLCLNKLYGGRIKLILVNFL